MSSGGTRIAGHPAKYQFGEFELFPNQGALWRAGVRVPLMPKPMATLLVLVDRAGETVSKDELLAEVWNGMAVEENNLTQSISTLRKALGEKRGENRFMPLSRATAIGSSPPLPGSRTRRSPPQKPSFLPGQMG